MSKEVRQTGVPKIFSTLNLDAKGYLFLSDTQKKAYSSYLHACHRYRKQPLTVAEWLYRNTERAKLASLKEISEALGIPERQVNIILIQAMRKIKHIILKNKKFRDLKYGV